MYKKSRIRFVSIFRTKYDFRFFLSSRIVYSSRSIHFREVLFVFKCFIPPQDWWRAELDIPTGGKLTQIWLLTILEYPNRFNKSPLWAFLKVKKIDLSRHPRQPAAGGNFLAFLILHTFENVFSKGFRHPNPQNFPPAAGILFLGSS